MEKVVRELLQHRRRRNAHYRRRLFPALLLLAVALLSGCMAALQPGTPPERPPASITIITPGLPELSPTLSATAPGITAEAIDPTEPVASAAPVVTAEATPVLPEASAVPEQVPTPDLLPTLVLPTAPVLSNEDRWRAQQIERVVFDPIQNYRTTSSDLWWYDPVNQQSIILGTISGDFAVQAEFVLRSQGRDALEVPYQVNRSYGLTALSPAILDRIAAAGYTEWIETYVFRAPNVVRR